MRNKIPAVIIFCMVFATIFPNACGPAFAAKQRYIYGIGGVVKPSVDDKRPVNTAERSGTLAELAKDYPEYFKVKGSDSLKQVALTFDDGPDDQYTAKILDILKKYDVRATFFVVGWRAKARPDLVRRMVKEKHVVGNHTYSHRELSWGSLYQFQQQVLSTQSAIKPSAGYAPKLLRTPYGAINEKQLKWAGAAGFVVIFWNVDSLDWKQLSPAQVSGNILRAVQPGSIILEHAGGGGGQNLSGTVNSLPHIIVTLRSRGYRFVTVPELLHIPKQK
ncbi:polysaccharide deacetylase family protein [Ferviditalea candida]|uniref:Polysaccharide deacetylase family protein n=1 Tax=Ferviditalea candida TaxID=3108399 RepID=A0ABU5ZGY4_9BACL|nr:polysaccharide deacetylase family protein [Paenibacillaceae bacterium T2]